MALSWHKTHKSNRKVFLSTVALQGWYPSNGLTLVCITCCKAIHLDARTRTEPQDYLWAIAKNLPSVALRLETSEGNNTPFNPHISTYYIRVSITFHSKVTCESWRCVWVQKWTHTHQALHVISLSMNVLICQFQKILRTSALQNTQKRYNKFESLKLHIKVTDLSNDAVM